MIDLNYFFPDSWDTAVRINVASSIGVALCCVVFLIMGYVRRGRLQVVQDAERWAITLFLITLTAFFVSRAIDVGRAGRTIASPWLLTIGVAVLIASVLAIVVVLRNWRNYELLTGLDRSHRPTFPEVERRKNGGRRSYDPEVSE